MCFPRSKILNESHITLLLSYSILNPTNNGLNSQYRALLSEFQDLKVSKSVIHRMIKCDAFQKALKQISMFIANPSLKASEIPKNIKFKDDNHEGIYPRKIAKYCSKKLSNINSTEHILDDIVHNISTVISEMNDFEQLENFHIIKELNKQMITYKMHKEKLLQNETVIEKVNDPILDLLQGIYNDS